jgi:hypothetical protein
MTWSWTVMSTLFSCLTTYRHFPSCVLVYCVGCLVLPWSYWWVSCCHVFPLRLTYFVWNHFVFDLRWFNFISTWTWRLRIYSLLTFTVKWKLNSCSSKAVSSLIVLSWTWFLNLMFAH